MTRSMLTFVITFAAGVIVGHLAVPLVSAQLAERGVVRAQSHKPIMMTHLFTGSDNQTHAEEVEMEFASGTPNDVSKMKPVIAAELHRGVPGSVADWHRAPRRQYVITLSGQGEIEVAGGKKISIGPGHIDLVEDVTGKGHTRVKGSEDRVTLQLPLADQSGR